MKKARYKVGQTFLVPYVVFEINEEGNYFIDIDGKKEEFATLQEWSDPIGVEEEELTDMIEFSDPDIRKQKIAAKIAALQQELNEIK